MTDPGVIRETNDNIVILKINNAGRANALSRLVVQDLAREVRALSNDPHTRVVMITGSGEKAFCAGADLKERESFDDQDIVQYVHMLRQTVQQLSELPMPTIAAINGIALGGGCELALGCDFLVMEEHGLIGLTELSWGIIPGAGGTQRLIQLVGVLKAKEMIFTAQRITAAQALEVGLINHLSKQGQAVEDSKQLAQKISKQAPVAVRLAKRAMNGYHLPNMSSGLEIEWQCYKQTIPTKDRLEGLAAFKEKREPNYRGE